MTYSTVSVELSTIEAIQDVTDKLDTALELDGAVYRFTENALEQAGGTSAEDVRIEMDANSTKLANLDATISSRATPAQVNAECDTAISDAALATSAELAAVQTHGDSEWSTADVSALATDADMQIALCLMQRRYAIDNPTYDSNNNLTSVRIRLYSDAASVGTDNNVLETLTMAATFSGAGKVTTYQVSDD